ncbi:hypothetical protein K435DRAFT_870975 [Dendrothele bispora CBS 962.96]|uniref:Uncharacterized protein n=1 Tax=Dendrothele bispora (strain CBS 962.96) TaxID=1314807 RepID=A0A4S8L589_DENBC|nr:hypothetical protein K435DRAFT_870975 [Dendrothele bispora CBS 962.96]
MLTGQTGQLRVLALHDNHLLMFRVPTLLPCLPLSLCTLSHQPCRASLNHSFPIVSSGVTPVTPGLKLVRSSPRPIMSCDTLHSSFHNAKINPSFRLL